MSVDFSPGNCPDPRFDRYMTPYCFGDLNDQKRDEFEQHLLTCDACWQEVQRLQRSVSVLRAAPDLTERVRTPEVIGVLGMSGRLDSPFAGHVAHALIASAMYALLYAVPVLVEVAYEFDRHGSVALRLAPLIFAWVFATTVGVLWLDVRLVQRQSTGLVRPLLALAASTILLCVAVLPFLPTDPMTQASFGTWPAHFAYLKSVFYAWLVGPVFVLWPFHFVVVMQRQLSEGRYRDVLALLTNDNMSVPPTGTRYPRVWALTAYLAGLFLLNYVGVNHLFGGLEAGPYKTLFMSLILIRVTVWLTLPAVCIWWYSGCLSELRRECLAVRSLEPQGSLPTVQAH